MSGRDDLASIAYGNGPDKRPSANVVDVTLRRGKDSRSGAAPAPLLRGLELRGLRQGLDLCGPRPWHPASGWRCAHQPRAAGRLPAVLRDRQEVFDRTGGLHAAALFDVGGTLLDVREDVGRHNAVDKVIGRALLERRLPLSEQILFVSGRGAFEIVQKALVAGVPVVASVSAPSSLAVELAREYGLTLIGFIRGQRFVVYSGNERLSHASANLVTLRHEDSGRRP